ncbi:M48 family metallopeptidase [Halorussus halophilus]|uniref:M48 family metallopeptidase n=1 Tax=Halorussus halophilus TaxID=2650975 RepID=UPI0013014355|nr:M48 family metalloprotease [Halorussus halophilus]
MERSLAVRVWTITFALVAVAAFGIYSLLRTGAPAPYVAFGVIAVAYISYQAWRSGGRFQFEFDVQSGKTHRLTNTPEIQHALFEICERAGRPVPKTMLVEMDVPGASVGYDDGDPMLAIDPRLLMVVGPTGLRAILAHELGHFGHDLHTDAIRLYLPQTIGFSAFWLAALAGSGPTVATLGSALYLGLALLSDRRAEFARAVLSVGVEPLALAASRYANRLEEYRADEFAAQLLSPAELTEALYRIAAVATGDNDEDVAGPVPWNADRSWLFSLFATHPSIESRSRALGCEIPAWVRPYRPHRVRRNESG